jgi:hypothetical protein
MAFMEESGRGGEREEKCSISKKKEYHYSMNEKSK